MELTSIKDLNDSTIEKLLLDIKNEDSFYKLYLLLKAPIYGYSLTILKNRDDALDNVQDVFITLYNQTDSYQVKTKPLNWIYTITKNKALSKLRKRKPLVDLEKEISSIEFATTDDSLLFKTLMEQLKEDERNIILLHLLWGFKHREIADMLDLNLSTILSKYNRAVKKLKEMEASI